MFDERSQVWIKVLKIFAVATFWKVGEITAKTAMKHTNTKRTSFYKLVGMMEVE